METITLTETQLKRLLKAEYQRGHKDGHMRGEQWSKDVIQQYKDEIIRQDELIKDLREN